ncbi:MAG TPA: universal stress protein [Acidimicrobiales bacterium]|nr:universal stress protein [Acidimicrobiales bacterium]
MVDTRTKILFEPWGGAMFRSIVVGTDGSPTATEAVRQATALARLGGGTVHLVSAYRPLESYATVAEALPPNVHDLIDPAGIARGVLDEAAAKVRAEGVECEVHGRAGDAAQALIEVAEANGADVIVVGNKGMHSKARFLLGSVPNKVSHHAPCAVLIARTA